jgi:hypothetical protein
MIVTLESILLIALTAFPNEIFVDMAMIFLMAMSCIFYYSLFLVTAGINMTELNLEYPLVLRLLTIVNNIFLLSLAFLNSHFYILAFAIPWFALISGLHVYSILINYGILTWEEDDED